MTIHLLRLAVGAESLDSMRAWCVEAQIPWKGRMVVPTHTKRPPTRTAQLLDGGCIYWVVKGVLSCRQPLVGFETVMDGEGASWCRMLLDPEIIAVDGGPHRPFQGWRYLDPAKAPPDRGAAGGGDELPAHVRAELRALGLD